MKRQIVFVEYSPTVHSYKMSRGLRESGKYETVLITFNKFDRTFFEEGYDKIIYLQINQKPNLKNFFSVLKTIMSRERREFFRQIKELNPDIIQTTGLSLVTFLFDILFRKRAKRVYYAYDILAFYGRKSGRSYKLSLREGFLKMFERYYFQKSDGIIHKGQKDELSYLDYKISAPDLTILPGCLEDWTHSPKKKSGKEIHVGYAGTPDSQEWYSASFMDVIKALSSQKIHIHTYGGSVIPKEHEMFSNEEKNNPYFHFHKKVSAEQLNEELSKYDYGIIPNFFKPGAINPLWAKNSMANKIFNYFEAGLPVIVGKDCTVMAELVEKNNLGVCVSYKELLELRRVLERLDYIRMQKNVTKIQKDWSIGNLTKELDHFYDRVMKVRPKISLPIS